MRSKSHRQRVMTSTMVQRARHENGLSRMITFGRRVHATITLTAKHRGMWALDQLSAHPLKLKVIALRLRQEHPDATVRAFIRETSASMWDEVEV